ncbi:MAG: hypothetical protein KatS3mg111_0979 [Pirellulaceae bacterium]|nr:MAG: hypothetical protein KatS3mg111_0979 [Pirellulaceae bacterium]
MDNTIDATKETPSDRCARSPPFRLDSSNCIAPVAPWRPASKAHRSRDYFRTAQQGLQFGMASHRKFTCCAADVPNNGSWKLMDGKVPFPALV